MQTKFFLTKFLREMRPGVLPMTSKQSDRVLNGLVRNPFGRRTSKGPDQDHVDNFFNSQGVVHKGFIPEGRRENAEFCKGVMDRLLKGIQRVRPSTFCSRDFFLLHDNAPAHKAASVSQF
jgi:hypothetical protein